MTQNARPVAIGIVAGIAAAVLPGAAGALVLVAGAVMAGWILPNAPTKAAGLFVLPTLVVGAVRTVIDDQTSVFPALVIGAVLALGLAAIFTYVGAGIAVRRNAV